MRLTRRDFLRTLAGLSIFPVFGFTFFPGKNRVKRYKLFDDYVAGVAYYDFSDPASLAALKIGEPVVLKRQPDNPYDRLAIEVYAEDGRKIGYIPRSHNIIPASLMDQGARLRGKIVALNGVDGPWQAIKVMLELLVPG